MNLSSNIILRTNIFSPTACMALKTAKPSVYCLFYQTFVVCKTFQPLTAAGGVLVCLNEALFMLARDTVAWVSPRCRVSHELARRRLGSTHHPLQYSPKRQGAYKRKHSVNKQEVSECYRKTVAIPSDKKPHILRVWWRSLSSSAESFGCPCGLSWKGRRGVCSGVPAQAFCFPRRPC